MHTASILSVCALVATFSTVQAVPKYAKLIPNGNGVAGVTAVGHTDPNAGGALNVFGKAFASAGDSWTEGLCKADSDGDGQTNGEELGDPCCTWKVGATPPVASGATDPGSEKSKLDDAALATARALCKGGSAAGPATVKPADGASNATPALTPGAPAAAPGAAPSAAPGAAPAAAPAPAGAAGATTSGSDGYDWVPIDQMNKTKSGVSSATTPSTSTSGGTSGAASSSTNSSKNSTSAAMATPLAGNSLMQVVAATVVGIVALAL